jgi:formate-dependent nitrite reductase cytochrome c552 subunit
MRRNDDGEREGCTGTLLLSNTNTCRGAQHAIDLSAAVSTVDSSHGPRKSTRWIGQAIDKALPVMALPGSIAVTAAAKYDRLRAAKVRGADSSKLAELVTAN